MLALVACGCGGGSHGPTATIHTGLEGTTVVTHHRDGSVIAEAEADSIGDFTIVIASDALVTIAYADGANLTTLAPARDGELSVEEAQPDTSPPVIIGTLAIQPTTSITADRYDVQLGCVTVHETDLSQAIDVAARCAGSDSNIDVLVLAYAGTNLAGYMAGRQSISDGGAILMAPWSTTTGTIPIQLDGVAPALDWVLYADGLPFAAQPLAATAPVWTGLAVDDAIVHATLGAAPAIQRTTRSIQGAPPAIELGAADFLPPISGTLTFAGGAAPALHWTTADPGADLVDVQLAWPSVTWDIVLPPDASDAALPAVLVPPEAPAGGLVRYLDSSATAGFDDAVAAGLHTDTIVAPSAAGQVRETAATGL
jgi:hypothetical protein